MNRLGIFCFYDKDGIVDEYINYLLKELREIVQELHIVINGYVEKRYIKTFEQYADKITMRNNWGFDIGAYTDVLMNVIGENRIAEWEEIVFCNDTFYGPFESFRIIFERMEKKKCDFWGLNEVRGELFDHIQSYFLVFRKKVIESGELLKYLSVHNDWEKLEILDVYAVYEVGLFQYLKGKGFQSDSYSYTENYEIYRSPTVCMEEYGLPILKKKSFSEEYRDTEEMLKCLCYVNLCTKYNVKYILQSIRRIYNIQIDKSKLCVEVYKTIKSKSIRYELPDISTDAIINYLSECAEVYIYGTGVFARKVWIFYRSNIKQFSGFIVSDGEKIGDSFLYGHPVKTYSSCDTPINVLIALNRKNTECVLITKKKDDRFFTLWKEWNDMY